jgi:hypothetical protein
VFGATAAQAFEGPYYTIESVRLEKGITAKVEGQAEKSYVLTAGTIKVTCVKHKLEKATLVGSTGASSGLSEEAFTFESCTVAGNGEKCEVSEGKFATGVLKDTLAFTNKESKAGEVLLIHYAPVSGGLIATIKFSGTCTLKEIAVEGSVDAEAWSGAKAVKAGEEPLDALAGEANFPAVSIKSSFSEEGGVRKENKPSLIAAGKAATLEGRTRMTLSSKELWAVQARPNVAPPKIERVDFMNNTPISIDHKLNATKEGPFKIKDVGEKNEVEWQSSTTAGFTKNWPIVYVRKSTPKLVARFKLDKSTEEFIKNKLEGNATVTGEFTIGGTALKLKTELTKAELEANVGFFVTKEFGTEPELPDKVLYEKPTITWKWKLKEKGQEAFEQKIGKTTHNFYLTFAAPLTGRTVYLTLLDLDTQGVEKEAAKQPPTDVEVIKGIWSEFKTKKIGLRWYEIEPGTLNRGGKTLNYYESKATEGQNLKQIVEGGSATCTIEPLEGLLKEAEGKCGGWADAYSYALASEGITSVQYEVGAEFGTGECAIFTNCIMLIKNWTFEAGGGTSGNPTFPYKATEVKDAAGVDGQGTANPWSAFKNHFIVEAKKGEGKLYDPSYGSGPFEGANKIKNYQEASIDAFCLRLEPGNETSCQKAPAAVQLALKEVEKYE